MESGELLFYCGIAVTAISLVAGIVSFVVLKIQAIRLHAMLDKEYGIQEKKHSRG